VHERASFRSGINTTPVRDPPFLTAASEMGQRVSGCFGHEQRICGERVRGEDYVLVSDPYAKPGLYSPRQKTERWLRTVAQDRSLEEQSNASTEVHSSHMDLHPDSRLIHGHTSPTNSSRIVASESPFSHVCVGLDLTVADVPMSASFPGTTEQFLQRLASLKNTTDV